jgi:S1-C subfamily serine protease
MTALDWIIIAFILLMALWGYLQGLVVSALSLGGFALGAFVGSRVGPLLLAGGSSSPYAPLFSLITALMVGGLAAVVFEAMGEGIRRRMAFPLAATIDGVGGALLVAALGFALVWIAGAVALQTPGARKFRKDIQRSFILSTLNGGPQADVRAPNRRIIRDPDVRRAHDSVVRILGTACGLAVQGSGWVASPEIVVTNAHVVAGEDDTTVQTDGGPKLDATAVVFDPHNDVAVLRVDGLGAPALAAHPNARAGEPVAILGFPQDGPYHASPGRLGETRTVISRDAYGAGPVQRRMTSIRGNIRSGNSGGPVVDADGQAVATVFAATTRGPRGGFGIPTGIVESDLGAAGGSVDTGPCVR